MKYRKGTFVVIPNTDYLKGKPLAQQSIFFWLCFHADEEGICYPSRIKLAEEVGVDVRTIDKYMKTLVEDGVVEKTVRKKSKSKENTSNLYQIMQVDTLGSESNVGGGSERDAPVTIPNINYTNITIDTAVAVEKSPEEKKSITRLIGRYKKLFKDKYGFDNKTSYGLLTKLFRELSEQYNEQQLSYLLIVYFNWRGMNESNDKEKAYLESKTHDLFTFKFNVNQYEAFARNVAGYSREFDSESGLLPIISKYYTDLTNNNSDVKLPSLLQR